MEDSKANENETILENETYDIFLNQVSTKEEPLTKTMEKNRSFLALLIMLKFFKIKIAKVACAKRNMI
jgi:hypothetical protein